MAAWTVRSAQIGDAQAIAELIIHYARKGLLLPRPLSQVYAHIRDYAVVEVDGRVVGCGALEVVWDSLGEVRSLAVEEGMRGLGIGRALVEYLLEDASRLGLKRVFALTYIEQFFEQFGFRKVPKESLPHKIWRDCIHCPKFPDCDEVAMLLELEYISPRNDRSL
ncbi:MAG TPA: N-acetyltransferase [Candidatus Latescibacteria bacterium]|nr:N-acetyltransferase [Candidatus Latescibacterota bacterium]